MPDNSDRPRAATRHADAWESPGFLLWHATLRWQRAVAASLEPFGITHVQFVVLATVWWLSSTQAPPRQRDIADHAGTDPMMTSQVVRTLMSKGLLTRTQDETDARAYRVEPTPDGLALVVPALKSVEDADDAFFAQLAPTARTGLTRVLHSLARPAG